MRKTLCALLSSFGLVLATPVGAQEAAQPERRPFNRLIENDDGGRLEVLVATYEQDDRTLVLHGAVHVADAEHYAELQRRFAAFDVLLYELIGDPDLRPYPGMELDGEHWISQLQDGMGSGLQLAAQFDCIDYRPDNFVHADMNEEQWLDALEAAESSEFGELFAGGLGEPDREAEAKRRPLDLVSAFRSGAGIAELRLFAARMMMEADADDGEPTVIIEGRNERCLEVLERELRNGHQKLGIYYGAAHMEHMERRLLEDLGWRRTKEEWLVAWDCRKSRFPAEEKGLKMKRFWAGRDLKKLHEAVLAYAAAHDDAPTWEALRAAAADGKLPGRQGGKDPWGRDYVLRKVGDGWQVRCLGSDGVDGTADDLVEGAVEDPPRRGPSAERAERLKQVEQRWRKQGPSGGG
ncbi:MAG: hypothetical protein H6835_19635 [Planctomycetes bacterium]|nr:hypothetical protein [Planctomycetota bacterium]